MSDKNEISEAGRKQRFERWEQLGVDVIRTDLEATGGLRFVGGPPNVRKLAWEWVRMKEAGRDDKAATPPREGAAKTESKDEWITAAEAVRLLKPISESEYAAKMTICRRAHAGLIRARAQHFIIDDRSAGGAELPKNFWWAEGG